MINNVIPTLEHSIMKHTPVAYINEYSLLFSTMRNSTEPFPEWVKTYINIKTKCMAVQKCIETDTGGIHVSAFINTESRYILNKIECAAAVVMARKIMNWDGNENFCVQYVYYPESQLYVLDLKEARLITM